MLMMRFIVADDHSIVRMGLRLMLQAEYFGLFNTGKNTKEMSVLLNLQRSTIYTHKFRIFKKLNINNMVELSALPKEYLLY
jgi:DNA-binding NarL/FixJ family response regulator